MAPGLLKDLKVAKTGNSIVGAKMVFWDVLGSIWVAFCYKLLRCEGLAVRLMSWEDVGNMWALVFCWNALGELAIMERGRPVMRILAGPLATNRQFGV